MRYIPLIIIVVALQCCVFVNRERHYAGGTIGESLISLQEAKAKGALSEDEYTKIRSAIVEDSIGKDKE